jgi:hypothetical protein
MSSWAARGLIGMTAVTEIPRTIRYLEPPTIPAGMTVDEFRRMRSDSLRPSTRWLFVRLRALG